MRTIIIKVLNAIQKDIDFWIVGNTGDRFKLELISEETILDEELKKILYSFKEYGLNYSFHKKNEKYYVFTLNF